MRKGPDARRVARFGLPVALALIAAASAPAALAAVTVEVVPAPDGKSPGTLKITGDAQGNGIYLDYKDKIFNVATPGDQLNAGAGCARPDANVNEVNCGTQLARVYADLGAGGNVGNTFNSFQLHPFIGELTVEVVGGADVDHVEGGAWTLEIVNGGGGNDIIGTGGSAGQKGNHHEVLKGGLGNDHLEGGKGPDRIDGGGGQDIMRGDHTAGTPDDGIDHIDAAETVENGETTNDLVIDCGGPQDEKQKDTYQLDKRDDATSVVPMNCETEQVVAVELTGAGDPAAGAKPDKPKPEEKVDVGVQAGDQKTKAVVKGKYVAPGNDPLGEDPKPKLAPSIGLTPFGAAAARKKVRVIPIRTRVVTLRPGVERSLEAAPSPRTQRALRRSLERGFIPTLTVTVEALGKKGKKGGKATRRDTATIAYGL
jgi:hypothetical protein